MAHCLTTFAFLHCVSETVKKKKQTKKKNTHNKVI